MAISGSTPISPAMPPLTERPWELLLKQHLEFEEDCKTSKRPVKRGCLFTGLFSYVVVFCLIVGGNLLSHTLPGAVPSARAGLASGFGMGNRAFPCRYRHRQIIGTTRVLMHGVLCQILHSGRVSHRKGCACFLSVRQESIFLVTCYKPTSVGCVCLLVY